MVCAHKSSVITTTLFEANVPGLLVRGGFTQSAQDSGSLIWHPAKKTKKKTTDMKERKRKNFIIGFLTFAKLTWFG